MRFYKRQHRHSCGIDLHVKTMYVCILDATGQVLVHRNVPSTPAALLEIVAPYGVDLVVAAERMFTWYWVADLCAAEGLAFVPLVFIIYRHNVGAEPRAAATSITTRTGASAPAPG